MKDLKKLIQSEYEDVCLDLNINHIISIYKKRTTQRATAITGVAICCFMIIYVLIRKKSTEF